MLRASELEHAVQNALTAIADRGYYKGGDILACGQAGMTPLLPKPLTSGAKADDRFGKQDFVPCPSGTPTGARPARP